jgi:hypothetical protein
VEHPASSTTQLKKTSQWRLFLYLKFNVTTDK